MPERRRGRAGRDAVSTAGSGVDIRMQDPAPKRARRGEVHSTLQREGRQKDLQEVVVSGKLTEVARVSEFMTRAAQEWQQMTHEQSVSVLPSVVASMVR